MCWIAITRYKNLTEIIDQQEYRWLDSLWIINLTHWIISKVSRTWLKEYQAEINKHLHKDWLCIMHHRKASIWKVKTANAHPFRGKKFTMMQNWTNRIFFNKYNTTYKYETDSEVLLYYLEERCNSLEDVLKELKSLNMKFWILIMVDLKSTEVLFYADWDRESYIKLQNWLVKNITNYAPNRQYGFENVWHVIFDIKWKIITKEFTLPLNDKRMPTVTYGTTSTTIYNKWESDKRFNEWKLNWNSTQKVLPWTNSWKPITDSELYNSWMNIWAVRVLLNDWVDTYEKLFKCTEIDLCFIDWMTTIFLEDIKETLSSLWMTLLEDEDNERIINESWMIDEFRREMEEEEAYIQSISRPYASKPVLKPRAKFTISTAWKEPKIIKIKNKPEEYFYSEEILFNDELLEMDMLCYLHRSKWTLKWYAYQCMWIEEDRAIKRVVGKSTYRRMKKIFKKAYDKAKL